MRGFLTPSLMTTPGTHFDMGTTRCATATGYCHQRLPIKVRSQHHPSTPSASRAKRSGRKPPRQRVRPLLRIGMGTLQRLRCFWHRMKRVDGGMGELKWSVCTPYIFVHNSRMAGNIESTCSRRRRMRPKAAGIHDGETVAQGACMQEKIRSTPRKTVLMCTTGPE